MASIARSGTRERINPRNVLINPLSGGPPKFFQGAAHAYLPSDAPGLDFWENAGQPGNWWGIVTDNGLPNGNPVIQTANDPAPGFYISRLLHLVNEPGRRKM
jgi:hypothetical protein